MNKIVTKKKSLYLLATVLLSVVMVKISLIVYHKYFDGWLTLEECEEKGGEVVSSLPGYSTYCTEGEKNIGKIEDVTIWMICCK